jgi:membrane-bound metal-dependent hydrolase YbcI (DUF457 family)
MNGINHVGLALAAPLALALFPETVQLIGLPTGLEWAALIAGGLAPDLDGGGLIARPSKFLPDIIPAWVERPLDRAGLAISRFIQTLLGHRGALHWPLWGALMLIAGHRLENPLLFWFGAGFLCHLLGDIVTRQGIPLLGPIISSKISIFPMRTGSKLEALIGLAIWLFVAWQIGASAYTEIVARL